jgi:translation initiation factor IF-3
LRNQRYQKPNNKPFFFLNYRIPAEELRVLDSTGQQLGLLKRDEAVQKAREEGLDLVLIAPKANPPVAKITDFKKFMYETEKKLKEAKKGAKKSVVKDIKISLFIGPADLDRMIAKTKEFLSDGNQVRLNLALKGREIVKKDMAFELMKKYITELGDINISKEPRLEGRVLRAVVAPKK